MAYQQPTQGNYAYAQYYTVTQASSYPTNTSTAVTQSGQSSSTSSTAALAESAYQYAYLQGAYNQPSQTVATADPTNTYTPATAAAYSYTATATPTQAYAYSAQTGQAAAANQLAQSYYVQPQQTPAYAATGYATPTVASTGAQPAAQTVQPQAAPQSSYYAYYAYSADPAQSTNVGNQAPSTAKASDQTQFQYAASAAQSQDWGGYQYQYPTTTQSTSTSYTSSQSQYNYNQYGSAPDKKPSRNSRDPRIHGKTNQTDQFANLESAGFNPYLDTGDQGRNNWQSHSQRPQRGRGRGTAGIPPASGDSRRMGGDGYQNRKPPGGANYEQTKPMSGRRFDDKNFDQGRKGNNDPHSNNKPQDDYYGSYGKRKGDFETNSEPSMFEGKRFRETPSRGRGRGQDRGRGQMSSRGRGRMPSRDREPPMSPPGDSSRGRAPMSSQVRDGHMPQRGGRGGQAGSRPPIPSPKEMLENRPLEPIRRGRGQRGPEPRGRGGRGPPDREPRGRGRRGPGPRSGSPRRGQSPSRLRYPDYEEPIHGPMYDYEEEYNAPNLMPGEPVRGRMGGPMRGRGRGPMRGGWRGSMRGGMGGPRFGGPGDFDGFSHDQEAPPPWMRGPGNDKRGPRPEAGPGNKMRGPRPRYWDEDLEFAPKSPPMLQQHREQQMRSGMRERRSPPMLGPMRERRRSLERPRPPVSLLDLNMERPPDFEGFDRSRSPPPMDEEEYVEEPPLPPELTIQLPKRLSIADFAGTNEESFLKERNLIKRRENRKAFRWEKKKFLLSNWKTEPKYICDVCQYGFDEESDRDLHFEKHVQCDIKGCGFKSIEVYINPHKIEQHQENIPSVQWSREVEDMKTWIAERKKNYPTAENIAASLELQKEKERLAAVLNTKEFGKMQMGKFQLFEGEDGQETTEEEATGTSEGGHKEGTELEPMEAETTVEGKSGTTDDVEMTTDASVGDTSEKREKAVVTFQLVTKEIPKKFMKKKTVKREPWRTSRPIMKDINVGGRHRHATLLEMLLAPEMRHERNLILQCVRHTVKVDFFEPQTEPANEEQKKDEGDGWGDDFWEKLAAEPVALDAYQDLMADIQREKEEEEKRVAREARRREEREKERKERHAERDKRRSERRNIHKKRREEKDEGKDAKDDGKDGKDDAAEAEGKDRKGEGKDGKAEAKDGKAEGKDGKDEDRDSKENTVKSEAGGKKVDVEMTDVSSHDTKEADGGEKTESEALVGNTDYSDDALKGKVMEESDGAKLQEKSQEAAESMETTEEGVQQEVQPAKDDGKGGQMDGGPEKEAETETSGEQKMEDEAAPSEETAAGENAQQGGEQEGSTVAQGDQGVEEAQDEAEVDEQQSRSRRRSRQDPEQTEESVDAPTPSTKESPAKSAEEDVEPPKGRGGRRKRSSRRESESTVDPPAEEEEEVGGGEVEDQAEEKPAKGRSTRRRSGRKAR